MPLSEALLRKYSKEYEQSESRKLSLNAHSISALDALLGDVYNAALPGKSDYEHRGRVVRMCDEMAKNVFGNSYGLPVMEAFGSFIMDMFTSASDLDLSLNFDSHNISSLSRDKKVSILRKLAKALRTFQRKGQVHNVLSILKARVPIIKFVVQDTGIECDISVENKDGIMKSVIIHQLSLIDERFRKLSFLMKLWAKTHGINCSKSNTLNSLSIIQLVAFHLQTREPPILPPLSALLKDEANLANLQDIISQFKHFSRPNKETIAELFISLLNKLSSVETLWEHGLCASIFEGAWIFKQWDSGVGIISVEDFTDHSENTARAVKKDEFKKIYSCIRNAAYQLSLFVRGQITPCDLKRLLFQEVADSKKTSTKRNYPYSDLAAVETLKKKSRYSDTERKSDQVWQNSQAHYQHKPYHSSQLLSVSQNQKPHIQWQHGPPYVIERHLPAGVNHGQMHIENPHSQPWFHHRSDIYLTPPVPPNPRNFRYPHSQSGFERFAEIYGTHPIPSHPQQQLHNLPSHSGFDRFTEIYGATPIPLSRFGDVPPNSYALNPRFYRR